MTWKEIFDLVDTLPYDAYWWKKSNRDQIAKAVKNLDKAGVDKELIYETVMSIYNATASEYGD